MDEPDEALVHNIASLPSYAELGEQVPADAPYWSRLLPDGTRDAGFHVPFVAASMHRLRRERRFHPPSDLPMISGPPVGTFAAHPLPDGKYLIDHYNFSGEIAQRRISRLNADGTADESFRAPAYPGFGGRLLILSDGSLLLGSTYYPAFHSHFLDGSSISNAEPVANGGIVVTGYRLVTPEGNPKIALLRADGSLDPDFQAPVPQPVIPRSHGLRPIARGDDIMAATFENRSDPVDYLASLHYDAPGARLLISGDFTHLGRIPRPGLAALGLKRPWRFPEWAMHHLPSGPRRAEQDPDRDGATNLHEYAVGSNPAVADHPPRLRPLRGKTPCFRLEVHPEAVDIDYVLELSNDLRHWHAAGESMASVLSQCHSGQHILTSSFGGSALLDARCPGNGASSIRVRFSTRWHGVTAPPTNPSLPFVAQRAKNGPPAPPSSPADKRKFLQSVKQSEKGN